MMNLRSAILLPVLVSAAACSSATPAPPAPSPKPRLSTTACRVALEVPAGWTRSCQTVQVPTSRRPGVDASRTLELYVERFVRGAGAPVVYLTGGPGVGIDAYAGLGVVPRLLEVVESELLLVEQRGNARSPGALGCSKGEELSSCLERLTAAGARPEAYNSVESAADVVDVADAFGHAKAVLWGHSYGSGLAQYIAKNHAARVSSLILEGVSEPTTPRGDQTRATLATLEAFGAWYSTRCATDDKCKSVYPKGLDPAAEATTLVAAFDADPSLAITLAPGIRLEQADLAVWFINGLATYQGMLLFSQLVYAQNRTTPTDRVEMERFLIVVGKGDVGAGAATVRGFVDTLAAITAEPSATIKSCFDLGFGGDATCAKLSAVDYPAELFRLDFRSALPTLFLNGALDTQTLPKESELVRPRFSNRTELTLPKCTGHFPLLDAGACAVEPIRAFLSGKTAALSPACAAGSVCDALPLNVAKP